MFWSVNRCIKFSKLNCVSGLVCFAISLNVYALAEKHKELADKAVSQSASSTPTSSSTSRSTSISTSDSGSASTSRSSSNSVSSSASSSSSGSSVSSQSSTSSFSKSTAGVEGTIHLHAKALAKAVAKEQGIPLDSAKFQAILEGVAGIRAGCFSDDRDSKMRREYEAIGKKKDKAIKKIVKKISEYSNHEGHLESAVEKVLRSFDSSKFSASSELPSDEEFGETLARDVIGKVQQEATRKFGEERSPYINPQRDSFVSATQSVVYGMTDDFEELVSIDEDYQDAIATYTLCTGFSQSKVWDTGQKKARYVNAKASSGQFVKAYHIYKKSRPFEPVFGIQSAASAQ